MNFDLKKIYILFLVFLNTSLVSQINFNSIPKINGEIEIDGFLTEPYWKNAFVIKDFYTYRPVDGQNASETTSVLLFYSESYLYVGFICFDPEPEKIRMTICRRDEIFDDDFIVMYLDTHNDTRNAYQFAFNPYGIQADGILSEGVGEDFNPDFLFQSKGRKFSQGYMIEIKIPFKSLRFSSDVVQNWGIGFLRRIQHLDKDIVWPAISRDKATFIAQFSTLYGLNGIESGHHLEILPELTANKQYQKKNDESDALEGKPLESEFGINLKYGITSNLTFDFTYNPDFSQIEADADKIDINRRFPIYYDEKRPFFLEGSNIFQTPVNSVYTRRIVDPVFGAKITGQIGNTTIGFISAADEYYGSKSNSFGTKYYNKNSYHSVVRLKQNIGSYSNTGILVTDKEFEDTYNRLYGIDGSYFFSNNYFFTFQALNAHTKRFYETKETQDPAFYMSLYRGSRTFNMQIIYQDIYPGFSADNGFLQRTDIRDASVKLWYNFLFSDAFFRLIQPGISTFRVYNHQQKPKLIEDGIIPYITLQLKGQTKITLRYLELMEEYNSLDHLINMYRFFNFDKQQLEIIFNNQTLSWLFFDISATGGSAVFYDAISYDLNPFSGYAQLIQSTTDIKPSRRFLIELKYSNYLFKGWNSGLQYKQSQDIYRLKTAFQFTRRLSLRTIFEYTNYYKNKNLFKISVNNNNVSDKYLDANILLSYEFSPGTVIYLGYNDILYKEPMRSSAFYQNFTRQLSGFFTKFSYLYNF